MYMSARKYVYWTREMVLNIIREMAAQSQLLNSQDAIAKNEKLVGAARRLFGNWGNAVEGGGTLSCLASMERLFSRMRAEKFDMIGITRKNRNYMLEAVRAAAEEMVISKN